MYGLFLRALQGHVESHFDRDAWAGVMAEAGVLAPGFEPLLPYDAALFGKVMRAAAARLDRPLGSLLEDVGNFIVTNPQQPAPRRLLRFGGASFPDFLTSLEELPDRARLALPDIDFPELTCREGPPGTHLLVWRSAVPELANLMLGVLRALADDYGALVLIEVGDSAAGTASLVCTLFEARHSEGRRFELAPAGGM